MGAGDAGGVRFDRHLLTDRLVRSKETGRVGILTGQITRPPQHGSSRRIVEVYVRPVGGGIEWVTTAADIELAPAEALPADQPEESSGHVKSS